MDRSITCCDSGDSIHVVLVALACAALAAASVSLTRFTERNPRIDALLLMSPPINRPALCRRFNSPSGAYLGKEEGTRRVEQGAAQSGGCNVIGCCAGETENERERACVRCQS